MPPEDPTASVMLSVVTRPAPWLTMANVMLGVRLVIAPVVLPYEAGGAPRDVVKDVAVGIVVTISAAAATMPSYRERAST